MHTAIGDEFISVLESFRQFLRSQPGIVADELRIETQVESLRDWSLIHSLEEFANWYLVQKKNCSMQVSDLPLNECRGWRIDSQTGDVTHESGEFFKVQGVRVSMSKDREVGEGGWDQPMVAQIGYDG